MVAAWKAKGLSGGCFGLTEVMRLRAVKAKYNEYSDLDKTEKETYYPFGTVSRRHRLATTSRQPIHRGEGLKGEKVWYAGTA